MIEFQQNKVNVRRIGIIIVAFVWLFFQFYIAFIRPLKPLIQNPFHLTLAMFIVILFHPMSKKIKSESCAKLFDILDAFILLSLVFVVWYLFSQADRLERRIQFIHPLLAIDYLTMALVILILLECVRRAMGPALVIFILVFQVYFWAGPYLPGILRHSGTNISDFTDLMVMGTEGIFGTPLSASSNFIYYFIFFGAFFADYGGGRVLIDMGMKVGKKGTSGPAKAAVLSSGLMGMVSGSAVANVATTGVMTIPLMKKTGYSMEEAGAIEAVASTGGQIMPPIMGIGAFLMAEIIGMPYAEIAFRSIIPALVYYFGIFVLVDFIDRRKHYNSLGSTAGISLIPESERIIPRLYLLFPVFVLLHFIIAGRSLMFSAVRGLFAILVFNVIQKLWKKSGLSLKQIFEGVLKATQQASEIAIPTGACGMIIGAVFMTGLATRMSNVIAGTQGTGIIVGLLVAMLGCLVLGMALPAVAAYLSAYVLFATPMIRLGLSPFVANLFLFYFGIFAQITPPVALASYAAAGISGGDVWKTGWKAFRFAIVAFLVPFVFVQDQGILLYGSAFNIIRATVLLVWGTFFLVVSVSGYLFVPIQKNFLRVIIFFVGVAIIMPEPLSTIIGSVLGAVLIIACMLYHQHQKKLTAL